jgi:hypothetical protein
MPQKELFGLFEIVLSSTMADNFFEATNFCSKFSKILNFNFLTFERTHKNSCCARTTWCDILRLITGLAIVIWMFVEFSDRALELTSRSVIFEIGIFMDTRLESCNVILVMMQVFFNRHEYFKIISNIQWIDEKVINYLRVTCVVIRHDD